MDLGQQNLLAVFSRFHGPVRRVLEVLLVGVVAILAARLAWLLISPTDSVAKQVDRPLPSPIQSTASGVSVTTDRSVLIQDNPFQQGAVEDIIEDVPETNLNLRLNGLRMSGEGGASGNAIIETPDGVGKNYRVGDEIIPGVTLERILSDRVIIIRDGATETLMLGGRVAGLSVISDGSQAVAPSASPSIERGNSRTSLPPISGRISGPEILFAAVSPVPVQTSGRVVGYRLNPRGDVGIMREAGLEPGDVLVRVDGADVGEFDIDEVLDRLSGVETTILQVERNGTARTIRLEFGG
ncbi:MAG: type II secretion system protein N [Henriciella sp.]|nr:hypothetical protein [Hyphomonadaceae bacterium]